MAFPELPAISRCHSYEIACKYTYRCTRCSYSIGRHSKSLDTDRKVCGYCYGKFELLLSSQAGRGRSQGSEGGVVGGTPSQAPPKTPRTPGAFALFVKENYGSIKKSRDNLKHADVMKILSAEFAKLKTNSK
ncbi:putative acidic repeat-containing protein-like [Penaeus vannamei]|uniref:Putative acidic repeat-containing protein-like n=1 Tax=Penaeus vannamei TaxID=6689 RepID=A0A3R7PPK2_PENVA|nr:HMG box-containing protein C19G7.04-like [Penaeus vannamei]ROT73100.1 putative acidic repeat-containing protein-like [Penaeus vannamei]